MKSILRIVGLVAVAIVVGSLTARADTFLTLCSPFGAVDAGRQIQTRVSGTYVADPNGCVALNLTKDVNGTDILGLIRQGFVAQYLQPCAGQVSLTSGSPSTATVTNSCFSGATNVVVANLCSGASAGAVLAVPSNGSLTITGPNTTTAKVCWERVQ